MKPGSAEWVLAMRTYYGQDRDVMFLLDAFEIYSLRSDLADTKESNDTTKQQQSTEAAADDEWTSGG